MTLLDVHNLIDFYINKAQGAYLSPEEKDAMLDVWQLALYTEYQTKNGTSENIDTALASFKAFFPFAAVDTPSGIITAPPNYFDLLDVYTTTVVNAQTRFHPVDFPNEDERTYRLASQLIPVSTENPFGEVISFGVFQLYPKTPQIGQLSYYRRPKRPQFVYTLISGRIINYDPVNSVQLEWSDEDINTIVINALTGVGINISAQDVQDWADKKATQNITTDLKT